MFGGTAYSQGRAIGGADGFSKSVILFFPKLILEMLQVLSPTGLDIRDCSSILCSLAFLVFCEAEVYCQNSKLAPTLQAADSSPV